MTLTLDVIQSRREAAAFLREREHDGHDVFLPTDKAAEFVGCATRAAFLMWAKRAGLTLLKRGRRVVVSRRDLEVEIRRSMMRGRR